MHVNLAKISRLDVYIDGRLGIYIYIYFSLKGVHQTTFMHEIRLLHSAIIWSTVLNDMGKGFLYRN